MISEIALLLWGTVMHRPYVYVFFAAFCALATLQAGFRRTAAFALVTWVVAFAAEASSIRNGFPFGAYSYFDATRDRELWIAGVPFWDSLSFVFLSWFSLALAAALLSPGAARGRGSWPGFGHRAAPLLGGLLMMLLDVVIDPVALQGDRWFLGRIYEYPSRGFYFGVTAANFAGWFLVGAASQWIFQRLARLGPWRREPWRPVGPRFVWLVYGVYAGVLAFNVAVTVLIQDIPLALASSAVAAMALWPMARGLRARRALVPEGAA